MPFPLLGANSAVAGGYEIDNSLRFNPSDSAYLTKTPSSTGNRRTWTFSCWFKLSSVGTDNFSLFTTKYVNGENTDIVVSSNKIQVYSVGTSGYDFQYATSRLFRDVSAWYHIVVAVDTTQGTDSNRVKIYINGSQVTSFSTTNHPNQNFDTFQNLSGEPTYIGASDVNVLSPAITRFFDGYLSEIYMIDGTQYAASDFGETDDNGVWIPKDAKDDLTFGTNGFYLQFQQKGTGTNSSGMGADTSGNDNHFAVNNLAAIDVTTDTPTNNFATMNSIDKTSGITTSEGNTKNVANSSHSAIRGTFGVKNGKWYWENKILSIGSGPAVGVMTANAILTDQLNATDQSRWYRNSGAKFNNSSETGSYGASYTTNDIIGIALNLDDGEITFYKNGSSQGVAFTDLLTSTTEHWLPAVKLYNEGIDVNFGNPPFSISSGNADANGYGNFEYAVPSGYYALCTKNLAEFG